MIFFKYNTLNFLFLRTSNSRFNVSIPLFCACNFDTDVEVDIEVDVATGVESGVEGVG